MNNIQNKTKMKPLYTTILINHHKLTAFTVFGMISQWNNLFVFYLQMYFLIAIVNVREKKQQHGKKMSTTLRFRWVFVHKYLCKSTNEKKEEDKFTIKEMQKKSLYVEFLLWILRKLFFHSLTWLFCLLFKKTYTISISCLPL